MAAVTVSPDLIPTGIVRLRVQPDDGRPAFTVLLDIEWERGGTIFGHEVNREGAKVSTFRSDGTEVLRDHLIEARLVTRRTPMWMNRTYAELEALRG